MLKKLSGKPIFFYMFSFLLPLVILLAALNALHITPFGDRTLVISDANGLYINYLGYAGRFFKGQEGFVYSFKKGLGGNMLPHMTGTMLMPFYFIVNFFDVSQYPLAFTWISVLDFCTSGLTMYILLASIFGHRRSNLIFSTSYALSGFLVANVFQIIFFTGPIMLPLMVLGLRRLLQGRRSILYFVSLSFCIITNLYFGFTLCVLSVLYFLGYMWVNKDELRGRRLALFCHYTIQSLCSGLISIAIWLPGMLATKGGRMDQTQITDYTFWEKMPFVEIFSKLFTGALSFSQLVDGLPNIYVGLLPVALVVLFFMDKKISVRIKTAAGAILAFYLLGFHIIAFDMLLCGGTTTNWFNFRYSYIVSFLLLLMAAQEWQHVDEIPNRNFRNCIIGMALATIIVFHKKYEFVMASEALMDFILILVVFLAYRLYRLKPEFNPRHTFELVTIVVVCFGLFVNYTISVNSIVDWGIKESDYARTVNSVNPLVKGIQKGDHGFYRMEVNKQRSHSLGNDPMLYGYNGVGHGGSNERNFVREELCKLGIQWFDMRSYYAQGIPAATDALVGIKYLIANEDVSEEKHYYRMTDMRKMGLAEEGEEIYDSFQNNYALPIAFVANEAVDDVELSFDDVFDNLNRVWSAISGSKRNVFVCEDDIDFTRINLGDAEDMNAEEAREIVRSYDEKKKTEESVSAQKQQPGHAPGASDGHPASDGSASGESNSDDGLITHNIMDVRPEFSSCVKFSFTARQDGPVYVYHRSALHIPGGSIETVIKYMGYYHEGETVEGYLPVSGENINRITFEEFAGRFRAAYADLDALEKASGMVTGRPSTVEMIQDGHLKGTVSVQENQELMFTIPWDESWSCYIDGEKAELNKTLGVFMTAKLTPGEHAFEMKYSSVDIRKYMWLSVAAGALLLLYVVIGRRLINRRLIKATAGSEISDQATGESGRPAEEHSPGAGEAENDTI